MFLSVNNQNVFLSLSPRRHSGFSSGGENPLNDISAGPDLSRLCACTQVTQRFFITDVSTLYCGEGNLLRFKF